jgi:site-specific DNA recombinase
VLPCFASRLTRNGEESGWIRNRLKLHRREAFEASTGLDLGNIGARMMGVMNEEALAKISADTHRGLSGRLERGLATGGVPFGYRTVPVVTGTDRHGQPVNAGFRIEIDPEHAELVRQLFEGYALQGLGLCALARRFNEGGAVSPRSKGKPRGFQPKDPTKHRPAWSGSAIREILRNPMYRGERVWNKSLRVKDHDSEKGRRIRYERPESEWMRQHDEAWRIVSDDLWQAAQKVLDTRNARCTRAVGTGKITWHAAGLGTVRKRLLAGFLRCAECGGSFHAIDRRSWGCSRFRNGGCDNALRIPGGVLERLILGAVEEDVFDAEVAAFAAKVALDELGARIEKSDRAGLATKLEELNAKIVRANEPSWPS